MKDQYFKRAEYMLYEYYRKHELTRLKNLVPTLKNDLETLEYRLKNTKIPPISDGVGGIDYSKPSIQSSSDGMSSFEREMYKLIEELEQEYIKTQRELFSTYDKIKAIERRNAEIESLIKICDAEMQKFVELKYKHNMSQRSIAIEMCISEAGISRTRQHIVKDIDNLLRMYKIA